MDVDRQRWLLPHDSPGWLGLDIGGANLKAADGRGRSESLRFELWRRPGDLADAVCELLSRFEAIPVALTMTGELADCYATKAEGVSAIVAAATQAIEKRSLRVATVDDRWLTPSEAVQAPAAVAAANWRLGARLVASALAPDAGVWIDVGSTTIDVIPFAEGSVVAWGRNDTERLWRQELLYTGVRRTPICAVVETLPYRGRNYPVAAEFFATTADAWLLLGELEANPEDTDTADGRPFTRSASAARMARCLCADTTSFHADDALAAARAVAEKQVGNLLAAVSSIPSGRAVVMSGEGEFLARRAIQETNPIVSLSDHLGADASYPFPAHAAAVLAAREMGSAP